MTGHLRKRCLIMVPHALARIADLAKDPRMPHNMFGTYLKTRKLRRLMEVKLSQRELYLAVTFDVECEYGSRRVTGSSISVNHFLSNLEDLSSNSTIFIEGCLIEENSRILQSLENRGFEIALHGYHHELWGPAKWYLRDRPISLREKVALLEKCKELFLRSGLRSPVSFRAPNLVSDRQTMNLLTHHGFRVDSSLPSQNGALPVPHLGEPRGLVRIPVSADPHPELSCTFLIPHFRFRVCNLKTLSDMSSQECVKFASGIVAIQQSLGVHPHLVVLAHSWEFFDAYDGRDEYRYCSPSNFEVLRNFVGALSDNFDVKQMSISDLAEKVSHRTASESY